MSNESQISDICLAEERGYARGKALFLKAAEIWCQKLFESAAFHPDQKVTQGQMRSANELLKHLKE